MEVSWCNVIKSRANHAAPQETQTNVLVERGDGGGDGVKATNKGFGIEAGGGLACSSYRAQSPSARRCR